MNKSLYLLNNIITKTELIICNINRLRYSVLALQNTLTSDRNISDNSDRNTLNNETIGQTAEQAMSDIYGIKSNINPCRISHIYLSKLKNTLNNFKQTHFGINIIEACGSKNNNVDFKCRDGKTLSLKSLKNNSGKICPQIIGQMTLKRWDETYKLERISTGSQEYNSQRYEYIQNNIETYLNNMLDNLYCCDYLLVISNCNSTPNWTLFNKITKHKFFTDKSRYISYSRPYYIQNWNETKKQFNGFSTSIRLLYDNKNYTVGELQFHNCGRCGIKFRFNWKFLKEMDVHFYN
tara:strand:- start:861 stop:1739 length:879 start_codon:yes stop_codon:yes gene_type:complete